MSTETVEKHVLAEQLSRLIFRSLFAHDEENDNKRSHHQRRGDLMQTMPDKLIPEVTAPEQVEIDDVLVVVEDDEYGNQLRTFTARDVIGYAQRARLVRVLSKSAKSLVVKWVDFPGRGNWTIDLADFGTPRMSHEPERLMLSSARREIGRLGTVEELRQKIANHPRFAEWQAAYAAACAEDEARRAAARAERETKEKRLAPIREAVAALNKIAGEPLVQLTYSNAVVGVTRWLHENGFQRLRIYLFGLHAVGKLTDEQQTEAFRHLDVIIAAAKEKK